MVSVVEYGDNIGTLKNFFTDLPQAVCFARRLMDLTDNKYKSVGSYKWYCAEKNEYIKIEGK